MDMKSLCPYLCAEEEKIQNGEIPFSSERVASLRMRQVKYLLAQKALIETELENERASIQYQKPSIMSLFIFFIMPSIMWSLFILFCFYPSLFTAFRYEGREHGCTFYKLSAFLHCNVHPMIYRSPFHI